MVNDWFLLFCSAGLGNTAPTAQCAPGYYCPGGQESSTPIGLECFAGHYCPQGSNYPIMCDNGTYQVNPGQDGCLTCPAGYFCDAASGKQKNKIHHQSMGHYNFLFKYILVSHNLREIGCRMVQIKSFNLILSLTGNVTYVNGN